MHGQRAGETISSYRKLQASPARTKGAVAGLANKILNYLILLKGIIFAEPTLVQPALATLPRDPNLSSTQAFAITPQKTAGLKLSETPSRSLATGEIIADRFEVQSHLSSGGFGQVFLALDRETGDKVVIKQKLFIDDDGAMECEHQAMSAINGAPQIPGYLGKFVTSDGQEVIVAEFVEGDNLRAFIHENEIAYSGNRGALGYFDYSLLSVEAITDIAFALAYAHQRGQLHTDLKPENMILNRNSREATLLDWGIVLYGMARQAQGDNVVFGTPSYMAPEQIMGRDLGPAADIYGLGIVVRQMFEGLTRPPISGQPIQTIIRRAREGIAFEWDLDANRLFPAFSPALRAEIAGFMEDMTHYDVNQRPRNMGEVRVAASKIAEQIRRERGMLLEKLESEGLWNSFAPSIQYTALAKVVALYNTLSASSVEIIHRLRNRISDRNEPIEEFMFFHVDALEQALPDSRLVSRLRQIWLEAKAEAIRPQSREQGEPPISTVHADLADGIVEGEKIAVFNSDRVNLAVDPQSKLA